MSDYYKVFDGEEILFAPDVNQRLTTVMITGQSFDSGAAISAGTMVYYDAAEEEWTVAGTSSGTPQGMYVGFDYVMISGLVVTTSGLTPGVYYWMNDDGFLTDNPENAFNGTRVGRALSSSELLLNIDTVGDNVVVEKA